MSLLSKWSQLYKIHKETNRSGLVKSLYKNQPLKKSWPYCLTFGIYVVISSVIFFLSFQYPFCILLVIPLIIGIYAWINFLISKTHKEYYQEHQLNAHPFYQRPKMLSYLFFIEKLEQAESIKKEDVLPLVDWEKLKNETHNSFSFFHTPIVLIILTASSGLVFDYLKLNDILETKVFMLMIFGIIFILWFTWSISDTINSSAKRNIEICRFLKWWDIE